MMFLKVLAVTLAAVMAAQADPFGSFPAVSVDDLHPLTLSWNQVHWLVRDNLLELDEIRKEQEDIYREMQACYGLEKCLKQFDMLYAPVSK